MCVLPIACGLVFADSITVEDQFFYDLGSNGTCFPGPCIDTFDVYLIPQFNPSLGTLQSVDYTFTDTQNAVWGFNDITLPPGLPFSFTMDSTLQSEDFPFIGFSSSKTDVGITSGQHDISFTEINSTTTYIATGEFNSGLNGFIGTSFLSFGQFQSTAGPSNGIVPLDNNVVYIGMHDVTDYATVQLTYNYTPAVPEPRGYSVLITLLLIAVVARHRRLRKRQTVEQNNA